MREHLLGYVLGVLDASEQAEVEAALRRNPGLRQELNRLQDRIEPLETLRDCHDPPEGLAHRTCLRLDEQLLAAAPPIEPPVAEPLPGDSPKEPTVGVGPWSGAEGAVEVGSGRGTRSGSGAGKLVHRRSGAGLSAIREPFGANGRAWTWSDTVVAAGVFLAAAMLFFPVIARSRLAARIARCQDNMRIVGTNLIIFSEQNGGRFPRIPSEGNTAYAGFYSTQLAEHELLPDSSLLICPGSPLAERLGQFIVPTRSLLNSARGPELKRLHLTGGGAYASSLGMVVNGLHQAPPNRSRAFYPLLADAPSVCREREQEPTLNHGGRGHNVLYEDGHVDFVRGHLADHCSDDPLVNDYGYVEAGNGIDDCVLAPSPTAPFLQRISWTR